MRINPLVSISDSVNAVGISLFGVQMQYWASSNNYNGVTFECAQFQRHLEVWSNMNFLQQVHHPQHRALFELHFQEHTLARI